MGIQMKKETEDRKTDHGNKSFQNPSCFQEQNPPEILKTTTHCMKRSASQTYLVRIHVARAPRIFQATICVLSLSLCLSLSVSLDRSLSRPRGRCGRLSRQNNGNEYDRGE
jgi:hypothetical protein